MNQIPEFSVILWFLMVIACITIPPRIMRWFGEKVLQKDVSEKKKIYDLMKIELLCVSSSMTYIIITILLGMLDRAYNILNSLLLPKIIKALLFIFIIVSPMLISIFLVTYEAVKLGTKITKGKIEKKDVFGELAQVLGPMFVFIFIWIILILSLPESLTSKWWFSFVLFSILVLIFFTIYPTIFIKIGPTYKLDPKLKEEILKFCSEYGVKVKDVVVKGKPEHEGANAMITGIIPNYRYIILTPTLLRDFDKEEIKAIVAHEIGHIKGKHLWINAFAAISWFLFWLGIVYGASNIGIDISSSPLTFFVILSFAVLFWNLGIESWIIRRNEFKADEFAARICGKEVTVRALKKLAEINLVPEKTGKWFEVISMHPSIENRIKHLQRL